MRVTFRQKCYIEKQNVHFVGLLCRPRCQLRTTVSLKTGIEWANSLPLTSASLALQLIRDNDTLVPERYTSTGLSQDGGVSRVVKIAHASCAPQTRS